MEKKKVVVALGHKALGTTLPEQQVAVKNAAKAIADLVEEGCQVAISHSNAPQVGMIHTALNEFGKEHENYTFAPMSVCSAMSQGYIGYDLQNAIREELLGRGILKTVSTIITQVVVDPYDEAFAEPIKVQVRPAAHPEHLPADRRHLYGYGTGSADLHPDLPAHCPRLRHERCAVRRYDGHESGCRHHHSSRWQRPVRGMLVGKATSGECDEKSGSVLCGNFHLTDAGHIHPCSERVAAYYAGPDVSPTVQMLVKPEQI